MKARALIISVCVALVLLTGVCGICFYEADYSGVLDGILAEVDGKTVIVSDFHIVNAKKYYQALKNGGSAFCDSCKTTMQQLLANACIQGN